MTDNIPYTIYTTDDLGGLTVVATSKAERNLEESKILDKYPDWGKVRWNEWEYEEEGFYRLRYKVAEVQSVTDDEI